MTFPFGFGQSGDGDDMSGQTGLFAELQKLLSGSGGPVNWELAKQLAASTMTGRHHRRPGRPRRRE